jgi:Bifunctional DNA primase/polymerase, N-terminal/Family of unknown function (DUF5906)
LAQALRRKPHLYYACPSLLLGRDDNHHVVGGDPMSAPASIKPDDSIVDHALYYAQLGWPVFPGRIGKKESHKSAEYSGGRKWGQTTDAAEIRRDFKKWPDANVCIVTGAVSGIFVVEADTKEGHDVDGIASLAALEAQHGELPPTLQAISPSGSVHYYFKHPGFKIINSASAIAPGIDVRGDGGMVVATPSVKPGKGVYSWRNQLPIADAPQWLLDRIAAGKEKETISQQAAALVRAPLDGFDESPAQGVHRGGGYIEAALRGEYDEVVRTPEGRRNHQLNDSSLKLGHYVGGGVLDENKAIDEMMKAAQTSGLLAEDGKAQCLATIRSGLDAGKREPKGIPERKVIQFPGTTPDLSERYAIGDFQAYLPMHQYIYIPTRDLWPAVAVNSQLEPMPVFDEHGKQKLAPSTKDKAGDVILGEPVFIKANTWLDENQSCAQMTWAPGMPMIIRDRLIAEGGWFDHPGANCFNMYRPPTIRHGDKTKSGRWVDHVKKVYPEDWEHIIKWLAHKVQFPQIKINHNIFLGGQVGVGKDTLLAPAVQAVGPWNCAEVSPEDMFGSFNGYLKSVILRVSEARDMGDVNKFQLYERMKTMGAAPPDVLRVNEKYLKEHYIANIVGGIITSNYKTDGIYLPGDDRRHYVAWSDVMPSAFESSPGAGDASKYFDAMWTWYEKEGGFDDIAAYLATLDLTGFNPKAPPPKTPAFWAIVDASRAPEEAELMDLLDKIGNPPAITIDNLLAGAAEGDSDLWDFLKERKNRKVAGHRIIAAGYEIVRNNDAKDGLWVVDKARKTIYAQKSLTVPERIKAAQKLVAQVAKDLEEAEAQRVEAEAQLIKAKEAQRIEAEAQRVAADLLQRIKVEDRRIKAEEAEARRVEAEDRRIKAEEAQRIEEEARRKPAKF